MAIYLHPIGDLFFQFLDGSAFVEIEIRDRCTIVVDGKATDGFLCSVEPPLRFDREVAESLPFGFRIPESEYVSEPTSTVFVELAPDPRELGTGFFEAARVRGLVEIGNPPTEDDLWPEGATAKCLVTDYRDLINRTH